MKRGVFGNRDRWIEWKQFRECVVIALKMGSFRDHVSLFDKFFCLSWAGFPVLTTKPQWSSSVLLEPSYMSAL